MPCSDQFGWWFAKAVVACGIFLTGLFLLADEHKWPPWPSFTRPSRSDQARR